PEISTDEPRAKQRAFPIWIWGCGGGCLLLMVLVFGGMFFVGNKIYKALGPAAAWPHVAEAMPFEPSEEEDGGPAGYSAFMVDLAVLEGFIDYLPGMSAEDLPDMPLERIITLFEVDADGDALSDNTAVLMMLPPGELTEEQLTELRSVADELSTGGEPAGEVETISLTFQGREIEAVRYQATASPAQQLQQTTGPRHVLEVDITNGRAKPIVLQFGGDDAPTVEELESFFAPFDVWGGK
ncbi:MAG: hypothetical protein AAFZ65_02145, partial [Planctomycetota bacterium]